MHEKTKMSGVSLSIKEELSMLMTETVCKQQNRL